MNNTLVVLLSTFLIIICIVSAIFINIKSQKQEIIQENRFYEKYLNKEIKGTDLATLIGKAVNENEKNKVVKDEKGHYIDNEENSIKIDLKMTTVKKVYPMEEIHNNEIASFVQYFNTVNFKCISIEYHKKTGRVAKLVFEEIQ